MPLVDTRPPPSPLNVRPLPTLVAACGAALAFVVSLAVVARLTADGVVMPARPVPATPGEAPPADSAPAPGSARDAASTSPGESDAGLELVTVAVDAGVLPDAGPADVPLPPFSPGDVVGAAVVVIEACAADALRWDPSLGGPFVIEVDLGPLFVVDADDAAVLLSTPGLTSPVLASCLRRRASAVALPALGDLASALSVRARASLGADGRVTWSDAVVTTSQAANVKPPPMQE
jgi:hypothetical protein